MFNQSTNVANSSATSQALAFTKAVSAGSLLIIAPRIGATGRTVTVTDDKGGTYVQVVTQAQTTDVHQAYIYSCIAQASGTTTVTVAIDGAAASVRYAIHEYFYALKSNTLDQTNSAQGATPLSSGNITTLWDRSLIFGMATNDNSGVLGWTPTSSPSTWNSRETVGGGGASFPAYTNDLIVSSSGTYASSPTNTSATNCTSLVASFKLSSNRPGNNLKNVSVGDGESRSEIAN